MGTNYYLRKRVTTDYKQRFKELAENNKFFNENDGNESIESLLSGLKESIHICKMSGGWQVSFDHNNGTYWQPTRESLEYWTHNPEYVIVDEYGEELTADEFWHKVDDWNAYPNNTWTSESYEKWEREENGHPNYGLESWDIEYKQRTRKKMIERFSIDTNGEDDFQVDGLRFSVYTDFS